MLKFIIFIIVLATLTPAMAADIGVSVSVGQPGFYGQIDIGNVPQPQVIYQTPVIIQTVPMGVAQRPVYLHVPPGHEKHWNKHCAKYNACGVPVYFVRDTWYNNVYVPSYKSHGHGHDYNHGHDSKHGNGKGNKNKHNK
jgi:hypothetical protein